MRTLTKPGTMLVAAHRGDSYNCFENTMDAFRAAVEVGADMIETDVRMTKDGILVLLHDETVDRTTNGSGPVSEMTYEELRQLNAGGIYKPVQIPTLEELLQYLSELPVLLNLEIKEYADEGNLDRCHRCIDQCVSLVEKYHVADSMVFNSFDAHVLEYINENWPGRYLLHGFYPYERMFHVRQDPDSYLYCACVYGDRNSAHYAYLKQHGIEPWIGAGATRQAHLQECFDLGARLVTTNFPADCILKLERIKARNEQREGNCV